MNERIRSWALTALIVLLTFTIAYTLFAYFTGRSVSNEDILIELRTNGCVTALAIEDRTPEGIAKCRAEAVDSITSDAG